MKRRAPILLLVAMLLALGACTTAQDWHPNTAERIDRLEPFVEELMESSEDDDG